MRRALAALVVATMTFASGAEAACNDPIHDGVVVDYLDRHPISGLGTGLTAAEAECLQQRLVVALAGQFGPPVGYKIGLTSKAAQAAFGTSQPVRGVLLAGMLLDSGATVAADYGARPVFEPDLLVTVKDDGVNAAATPEEVARHLDRIYPFIELADLALEKGEFLSAATITAVNVGARLGVRGAPAAVEPTPDFVRAVATMTVTVRDGQGRELSRASGSDILGHPFNAVVWLARDLAAQGRKLRAGDVISVGSFARPQPAQPGRSVAVVYEGLPGGRREVSVSFR